MAIPTEPAVRNILAPEREAKLWRAFHQAWDDVMADIPRYSIWPRSRANMMFERLAVRLQEEFAGESTRVRFNFATETVKIVFDDTLLVRCKKANGRGLGQNVETQAVLQFCESDSDLLGFTGFDKIEIVYVVNAFGTSLRKIMVQARDGDQRIWAYPIERPEAAHGGAPVVPLPPRTPPVPPSDASDLVKPRTKPVRREENDQEK